MEKGICRSTEKRASAVSAPRTATVPPSTRGPNKSHSQSGENTHANTSTYLANRVSRCAVSGSQLPRRKAVETRSLQIGSLAENFRRASKEPLKGCARSEPDHVQGRFPPLPGRRVSVQSTLTSKEKL